VESEVGEGSVLYPRATLYHQVKLGKRCIIHAGAVIGADGFGYAWTGSEYFKIPQAGVVVLEDDVEIGANTCIDRARFGETRIGRGSKLDNLIQIAHNVRLGAFCAFAAQVGVAGSARIGNGVQIGGQTAVVGHITLGDRLTIVGQSGVTKSIPGAEAGVPEKDRVWIGTPAQPMREQLKEWQNLKGLARLRKKVREMAERLTGGEGNQT
jgi:UDP-3-O-[3-hydroxymyristoyl] glucosamine N-acyltransferase